MSDGDWLIALQKDINDIHTKLDKIEGVKVSHILRFVACSSLNAAYAPGLSLFARRLSLMRAAEALKDIELT